MDAHLYISDLFRHVFREADNFSECKGFLEMEYRDEEVEIMDFAEFEIYGSMLSLMFNVFRGDKDTYWNNQHEPFISLYIDMISYTVSHEVEKR